MERQPYGAGKAPAMILAAVAAIATLCLFVAGIYADNWFLAYNRDVLHNDTFTSQSAVTHSLTSHSLVIAGCLIALFIVMTIVNMAWQQTKLMMLSTFVFATTFAAILFQNRYFFARNVFRTMTPDHQLELNPIAIMLYPMLISVGVAIGLTGAIFLLRMVKQSLSPDRKH
ncbi:hypothetical protein FJU08_12675 [Martelella alba]|uniref:Uncharacterized protein n=1 Tax=Martelella alba TaxID=2590451 RepID=A0A506UAN4_9HYPH|nr:hypothetical protein [Martelella alba]TPW30161.1 hypothetical protein FJU08_12675 [Martelella alba]